MPMTVDDLIKMRRMALHRLHLLESGDMAFRFPKTAKLDNASAIAATRSQIADIDAALAERGHRHASRSHAALRSASA